MYVATFRLEYKPWLVRADVVSSVGLMAQTYEAKFTRTDEDGSVHSTHAPIGPDEFDVGLPTLAIVELVHQLNFVGVQGGIHIVHASPEFTQELLDLILAQMGKGLAIQSLATTATVQ